MERKEKLLAGVEEKNLSMTAPEAQGICFFKTGPGEDEGIAVEDMLMKLATIEMVLNAFCTYANQIGADDGQEEEYNQPPDSWAIAAACTDLARVSHAIKCGCWGYKAASFH